MFPFLLSAQFTVSPFSLLPPIWVLCKPVFFPHLPSRPFACPPLIPLLILPLILPLIFRLRVVWRCRYDFLSLCPYSLVDGPWRPLCVVVESVNRTNGEKRKQKTKENVGICPREEEMKKKKKKLITDLTCHTILLARRPRPQSPSPHCQIPTPYQGELFRARRDQLSDRAIDPANLDRKNPTTNPKERVEPAIH
ncbi:hypothetical protein DFJ73DRAFT_308524 [Zopfochytrium polystomum]|nr:hypothetical protein DFJ73DRAFT_308524 [Zopfochytrium polystomum]